MAVALGGFLMDFDASVISGIAGFIDTGLRLTDLQLGWAVASLTLSATVSMMVCGPLADRHGRRRVLRIAALLFGVSAVASAFAPNFMLLVMARMLGGLGVGAALIVAPAYIADHARRYPRASGRAEPAQHRGRYLGRLLQQLPDSAAGAGGYAVARVAGTRRLELALDARGGVTAVTDRPSRPAAAIRADNGLILAALPGFVASFPISLGPAMWVLFSELFANRIPGLAISLVGLVNSSVSFLVQLLFPGR